MEVSDITYLPVGKTGKSEFTPTPIAIERRYYAIGVGVQFADGIDISDVNAYNLRRFAP